MEPVIDMHHHLGEPGQGDHVFEWYEEIEDVLQAMDAHHVTATILQPLGGAADPRRVHDAIAEHQSRHPGRIFGMASVNPRLFGPEETRKELERCIRDLGFVGIKHHSLAFAIEPTSRIADPLWEAAARFRVPILCCTGDFALPFTSPGMLIPRLQQYPDLPIILGHMGGAYSLCQEAINIARLFPNAYLDTSLAFNIYVRRAIDAVRADRMMLACEHSSNVPVELAKVRSIGLDQPGLSQVLGGTARKLFRLQI